MTDEEKVALKATITRSRTTYIRRSGVKDGRAQYSADIDNAIMEDILEALDLPARDAAIRAETLREAARHGYEVCAATRHLMLGDAVALAILALIEGTEA